MTSEDADKNPQEQIDFERKVSRLKSVFLEVCTREGLLATLEGHARDLRLQFKDQAGLSGDQLKSVFCEEMRNAGVIADQHLSSVSTGEEADLALAEKAIRHALSATRKRLVDRDAFISGGLAYPFDPPADLFRERGIALYRYPIPADVTLAVSKGRVNIRFAAHDLGEITSSGFWVPTWLAGDFDIRMRYMIRSWKPGAKPACFGLWVSNRTTGFTCYAQRTTEDGCTTRLGAVMGNQPLRHAAVADRDKGELRIMRERTRITALHRTRGKWLFLADINQGEPEDMITGAKIWAHGECGPLEAEVSKLEIEAALSSNQDQPPPFLADAHCLAEPI